MKSVTQHRLINLGRVIMGAVVIISGLASIVATTHQQSEGESVTVAHFFTPNHVRTGSRVDLDARSSSIAPGDAYIRCSWVLRGFPPGSQAELNNTHTVNPSFIADVDGEYTIELNTIASSGDFYEDKITGTVNAYTGNAPPVAEAGAYQEVMIGETVHLDGSLSFDADDDVLGYSWAFAPAASEPLSDRFVSDPSFVATLRTSYKLELVVNDGVDTSFRDTVTIEVNLPQNSYPVAMAGPDQYVVTGSTVQLDGSASHSPEPSLAGSTSLDYEWNIQYRPPASEAVLSNVNAVRPTFVADVDGAYLIALRVTDDDRTSRGHIDEIMNNKVVVIAGNGNTPPVADGGPDFVIDEGVEVTLDGSNSSDAENALLSYNWSMFKAPAGSIHSVLSGAAETISFTPDLNGTYLVRLVVNDGQDDSAPDIVRVVADIPDIGINLPPAADAGPDQPDAIVGVLVTLDGSGSTDPENQPLTYLWSFLDRPANSSASLSDSTAESPTFTPDLVGGYVLRLVVNDGSLDSLPASVTVTASEAGSSVPLTLNTALPYLPTAPEAATLIMIDLVGIDTLDLASSADFDTADQHVALYTHTDFGMPPQAEFHTNSSWTLIFASHANPVSDTATPSFIVQRNADGQYYKITLDFTLVGGMLIQIDAIQAWNCGASQTNCPP